MFGLGSQEIIIILIIALVIFGAGKLPQIGEGMGKAIKNFKKAAKDAEEAIDITPENEEKSAKSEDAEAEVKKESQS